FGFGLLLRELARRADGAPKACETTTKNENMFLHGRALLISDCLYNGAVLIEGLQRGTNSCQYRCPSWERSSEPRANHLPLSFSSQKQTVIQPVSRFQRT